MRPLKLEMCAWGPYPDKIYIDFEAVGKNHIFLLTGPTGAGKTTIFDGITYGLYGNVSGQYREKASVRSDFAGTDKETYVELRFSHKEKIYTIRRSPRFDRPKKRGEGMKTCPEQAELYMPDGQIISGATAVTQAVKQLMGIDYHQFKQISMIAQGEFLDLLLADSEKRVEIFRHIFNTDVFHRIQVRLSEQSKQLLANISELKIAMNTNIVSISTDNDQLRACVQKEQPDVRKVMDYLKVENLSDKGYMNDLAGKIKEVRKQSEQLTKEVERLNIDYENLKEKIVQIKGFETNIRKLERRLETAERNFAAINKYEEERDAIAGQLPVLRMQAVSLERYENVCGLYRQEKEKFVQLNRKYKQLKQKVKEDERRIRLNDAKAQRLTNLEFQKMALTDKIKEKYKIKEDLELILNKLDQMAQMTVEHGHLAEAYKKNHRQTDIKKEVYEINDNLKKQAAAGILALGLMEGEPCPVCGSTCHPQRAKIIHEVVDEQKLKELKDDYERSAKMDEQILGDASKLKGSMEQLEQDILISVHPYYRRMKLGKSTDFGTMRERVQSYLAKIMSVIQTCQEKLAEVEKLTSSIQKYVDGQKQLALNYQKNKEHYGDIAENLRESEVALSKLSGEREQLASQCPSRYKSKTAIDQRIHRLLKQQENLNAKIKNITETKENLRREKGEQEICLEQLLSGLDRSLLNQALNKVSKKMTDLKKKKDALDKRAAVLDEDRSQLRVRLSKNEQIFQYLDEHIEEKEALEGEYGYVSDLEQKCRGNNSKKLTFEQYVLGSYFQDILSAANIRLGGMTSGRYELFKVDTVYDRRKTNSLEIEVLDHYTGKKRSVKSLSGGESFKAALALALGMSDIIQNNVGGIEIETLFIDEGFGSLDEESLNQAVKVLMTLTQSSRLVGIISHVPQLREQIEDQILIEKTCSGSYIYKSV